MRAHRSCQTLCVDRTSQALHVDIRSSNKGGRHLCTLDMVPEVLFLILLGACFGAGHSSWPGCHLYAFKVPVMKGDMGRGPCVATLNACVGYCNSIAFPSKYSVLVASDFKHNITSMSECCVISEVEKVPVRLSCGVHEDEAEVYTAKRCRCDMCRFSNN
uniref:glycoprotein hormone alpha-2 n=1 Tax=Myxine glutinosa TaxID=7769 RepID=UPI00358F30D4